MARINIILVQAEPMLEWMTSNSVDDALNPRLSLSKEKRESQPCAPVN
jgi:hypothetical protein